MLHRVTKLGFQLGLARNNFIPLLGLSQASQVAVVYGMRADSYQTTCVQLPDLVPGKVIVATALLGLRGFIMAACANAPLAGFPAVNDVVRSFHLVFGKEAKSLHLIGIAIVEGDNHWLVW